MNEYLSSDSRYSNKENMNKKHMSRLDKIMKLKINKPQVNSTLNNYKPITQPKKTPKSNKENKENSFIQMKEC